MKRIDFIKKSTLGIAGIDPFYSYLKKLSNSESIIPQESDQADTPAVDYYFENPEIMNHLDSARSGLAHGGIGAGSMELRKDGIFYNWSLFNNRPRFTAESFPFEDDSMLFFVIRFQIPNNPPRMKLLQIDRGDRIAGIRNQVYGFPWLSGVETIEYQARYPFTKIKFSDAEMPFDVFLEAWHPFIPHDQKNSALPLVFFDFKVNAKSTEPVDVMLMCSSRSGVGFDVQQKFHKAIISRRSDNLLCTMSCDGMKPDHDTYGTQTLISFSPESTYYAGWNYREPYYVDALWNGKLPDANEVHNLTTKDSKTGKEWGSNRCFSTVAVSQKLNPSQVFQHSFAYTWSFPNLYSEDRSTKVGHFYSNFFDNSEDVADYAIKNKGFLHSRSKFFLDSLYQSTLKEVVLDQINSHLNTFSSSSWFIKNGRFGIEEGLTAGKSWGPVATMDVGLYGSVPIAALFPELSKGIMRSFMELQTPDGKIGHGLALGLNRLADSTDWQYKRVDLPAEYVIQTLRDFFWTNDQKYLKEMWPSLKKAINYILKDRDVTGNSMPYIEGQFECSYDTFPMYGFSAYVVTLWLAALHLAIEAAKVLGDHEASNLYRNIFEKGEKLFQEKLWTGSYYRLYVNDYGEHQGTDDGCFTDQIIGQWITHLTGLPPIYPKEKIVKSLQTIMQMSFESGFGLRNCSWPGDKWFHKLPKDVGVDQANTMWSGVELAFASFLMYEGFYKEAMNIFETVNQRYRKRGYYFDHFEWGGHYYRPMSSWTLLNAALGMNINQAVFTFEPKVPDKELRIMFAAAYGTAFFERKNEQGKQQITLRGLSGEISIRQLNLSGYSSNDITRVEFQKNGRLIQVNKKFDMGKKLLMLSFKSQMNLGSEDLIEIKLI